MFMFIIEDEVTVADLDEALSHVYKQLKIDEFGNRMNWKKRELLMSSINDLLDARLEAMNGQITHVK